MGQKVSRRAGLPRYGDGDGSNYYADASDSVSRSGRKILQASSSSSSNPPPSLHSQTRSYSGIVKIKLEQAEMEFKDRWFACISLGQQTFRTARSSHTDKPIWKSEKKIALEENGPRIARISVFETNRLSKNNLVGYCEVDLSSALDDGNDNNCERTLDLYDPSTKTKTVGSITFGYSAEDRLETERSFAKRLLQIMDYDESGELSMQEFRDLIKAFGAKASTREIEELFLQADTNKDGNVNSDELAGLLAEYQEKSGLMNRCPVCGEKLGKSQSIDDVIHISLCFDEGTGYQTMTGGFLTEKQASYGWMFKLSEWAHLSSYDIGLKEGSKSSHILVFDRRTQRLDEELIDNKIVLAIRAIYQSKLGLTLIDKGTKELLSNLSKKQGIEMSSPESAKNIPKFIEFFQDRINIDEFKDPVESYKTFNDFFTRELKPGVRPIDNEENDYVAVCAADCRLMVYKSVDDAKRFWIKGRKFSIKGLLGEEVATNDFEGGSIAIFRLAPQDYHRFHVPITGVIGKNVPIPGNLYTVNPIAVNSKYCNVFTDNKREVNIIESKEFGKMAFVAIGATMVGSITFTKTEGDRVQKGEEFGFFSFGGSTVICVFEKGAIDFDEDLVANSEKSLETLVYMGMSLGFSTRMPEEDVATTPRPSVKNSVLGLDNEIAKKGIMASTSFNARCAHFGELDETGDDSLEF